MFQSEINNFPVRRGKVRDVYDLGKELVIVTTDRISCFDRVLPTIIPNKGRVLTAVTEFWLNFLGVKNHLITSDISKMPVEFQAEEFKDRTMLVKKCTPFPVECIVRGYISGSGWKEYLTTGAICGIQLPARMQENMPFCDPIFTPSTKAETGHDENISFDQMASVISHLCPEPEQFTNMGMNRITASQLSHMSLSVYKKAHNYAWNRGIIIADTKFEWGLYKGEITLIDEVMTPDSSRYWPMEGYCLGKSPPSLDKQYVRDYLTETKWDKNSEPPTLPEEVVQRTSFIYAKLYECMTGKKWLY